MKRFSLWFLVFTFAACVARGQDAATQQQIDKLSGQIKDMTDTVELQRKRIDALEKDIRELRDKVNTPQVSDSASREDLKKLAEQVQEIDRKRQDDQERVLKNLEKLGRAVSAPPPVHKTADAVSTLPAGPLNGIEYTVKSGDTISAIAKACRDQGIKVTSTQILSANPGLDPTKLYVGKKIFIPDGSGK